MEFDVGASPAPGMKKCRVDTIVAECFGTRQVVLIFDTQPKDLLDVVVLAVIRLSLWQIHCAAPKDSLSASAASENFFRVLAAATDLVAVVYVQQMKEVALQWFSEILFLNIHFQSNNYDDDCSHSFIKLQF